jgi:8-oxo-dGTP pyrophosphatase MutT (NUDIX family)
MINWAGLLIIKDRKFLADKEYGKVFFALPGGGKEIGETDQDTIKREIYEELGFNISGPYNLFLETELPGKGENEIVHFMVYQAEIPNIDNLITKGKDIEMVEWINTVIAKDKNLNLSHLIEWKILPLLKAQNLID